MGGQRGSEGAPNPGRVNNRGASLRGTPKGKEGRSDFVDLLNYISLTNQTPDRSVHETLEELPEGQPLYSKMTDRKYPGLEVAHLQIDYVEMDAEQVNPLVVGIADYVLEDSMSENDRATDRANSMPEKSSDIAKDNRKQKHSVFSDVYPDLHLTSVVLQEHLLIYEENTQSTEASKHSLLKPPASVLGLSEAQPAFDYAIAKNIYEDGIMQFNLLSTVNPDSNRITTTNETGAISESGVDGNESIFMDIGARIIDEDSPIDPGVLYEMESQKSGVSSEQLRINEQPRTDNRITGTVKQELNCLEVTDWMATSVTVARGFEGQIQSKFLADDSDGYSSREVIEQVEQKLVSGMRGKELSEFSVSLKPDGLGSIKVKMVEKEGLIRLEIVAERAETERILSSEIDQLRQALKTQNIDSIKITNDSSLHGVFHHAGGSGSFASQEQLQWDFGDRGKHLRYQANITDSNQKNEHDPDYSTLRTYSSGHLEITI